MTIRIVKVYPSSYIAGYIPLSGELVREMQLTAMGPEYGPPLPTHIAMRRELGGHPGGEYRRAA